MTDHHFLFIDLMPNVCLPIPSHCQWRDEKEQYEPPHHDHHLDDEWVVGGAPQTTAITGCGGGTWHDSLHSRGRKIKDGGWRLPSQLSTLDMTSSSPNPNLWPKACSLGRRVCIQVFYQVVWLRGDKMTLVAFEELKWIGACHSSRICPAGPTGGSLGRRTV